MERPWTFQFAEFTPAEIERIADLSAELQRVWRRRGHLPPSDRTQARFDAVLAAQIAIRYVLAMRGVSPAHSASIGKAAAAHVLWAALMDADGACEVIGEARALTDFEQAFHQDDTLIAQMVGLSRGEAKRFIIAEENEEPALENDFDAIEIAASTSGFFVSLVALGHQLVERAQRPLVTVHLGPPATNAAERRRQQRRLMHPWRR